MNLKQKLFNYFNNLIFSCAILWAILIILSFNDLKPEIIIRFFFIIPLLLSLIFYPRQIFILLKGSPRLLKNFFTNNIFRLVLFIGGIFFDVFILKFTSDFVILFLIGLWILSIHYFKFKRRISICLALILLILSSFLSILGKALIVEKMVVWVFIFLTIGVIQSLLESRKEKSEI